MPKLRPVDHGQHAGNQQQRLRALKQATEELGVQLPTFDRAFELAEHARSISRLRGERKAARPARIREVARAVGRQELAVDKALKLAVEIDVQADPESAWFAILEQGSHAAMSAAFEVLQDPQESIIGTLRPMIDSVLSEIAKLRRAIPGEVGGAAEASRAGAKVASSWSEYEALIARWEQIFALVALLRREGVLPDPDGVDALRPNLQADRWANLLGREDWLRRDPRPNVRLLLDPESDSWKPGLYTAGEIEEHVREARAEVRAEARRTDELDVRAEWPAEVL